ncbi:MAG TPA: hypothetical protein PKO17_07260, partial [Pseudomonadales bacterium]|nr:hypothetical protein [Pseudomonadales bacterium]
LRGSCAACSTTRSATLSTPVLIVVLLYCYGYVGNETYFGAKITLRWIASTARPIAVLAILDLLR